MKRGTKPVVDDLYCGPSTRYRVGRDRCQFLETAEDTARRLARKTGRDVYITDLAGRKLYVAIPGAPMVFSVRRASR